MVATSTLAFDVANRHDLLADQLENYRRGVADAARPACCPAPFDVANNWMHEYPTAYVIPLGGGQRSDAEANHLAQWLLDNGIEVTQLNKAATFGSQQFGQGSYVVWMDQAHRGLIETTLSIGDDVSSQIGVLYAPPAAWSHGSLWGADVVQIPRGASFAPATHAVFSPQKLSGGVEPGPAGAYVLEIDSPTAVRTLNSLIASGVGTEIATASFSGGGRTYPAGTAIFSASDKQTLDRVGKDDGLRFGVAGAALPAREPRTSVPRIAVLTGGLTQEIWVLRDLGFTADPVATGNTSALNTPSAPDPLAGYDVVYNQAGWPARRDGAGAADVVLRQPRRLRRGGHRRHGVPHVGRPGVRPDGGEPQRQRPQRHRLLGQRRRRDQPDRRRLPGARHGDHGPADVADGRPGLAADRREAAQLGLLRRRAVAARRAVGERPGRPARSRTARTRRAVRG